MDRTQRLAQPYLAFFRSGLRQPELLRVHLVTAIANGGRIDIAICGKSTATHRWFAVNDAETHLKKRFIACRGCCERKPDQFTQFPRTL